MDNIMIKDTCEVIIVDDVNGKSFLFGSTESTAVKTAINKEELTGGIGNLVKAIVQSQKKINFEVKNLFHSDNAIELTQGGTFASGSRDILKKETLQAIEKDGGVKITLKGSPKNGSTIKVVDNLNQEYVVANKSGVLTITNGTAGKYYTAIYTVTESKVDFLDLNATTFPHTVHVQLHTIGFDPETNSVLYDYYWDFPKALPEGTIDTAYTKGTNTNQTINFTAIANDENSYGTYMRVAR
jgi:hypothetical protein